MVTIAKDDGSYKAWVQEPKYSDTGWYDLSKC